MTAAVGASEQPGLAPQGEAAQGALGGIVGQADSSIVEERVKDGQRFSM